MRASALAPVFRARARRAAIGVKALLIKLGRNAELKQLQYTVKLINARLDEATEETRAAQEAEGS